MLNIRNFALVVASAILLAACSSPVKLDDKAVPVVDSGANNGADTRSVNTVDAGSADPLNQPGGILSKRSIYFDFDSYIVKDEFKSVVEAHAQYLNSHKNRKIIIQGNTDDRGGREYNLALGQKRAEAVRKALVLLGVSDTQVEAVSLGKEKPKATGSDEASYAENRRSDIVYQ
ncbi:peptidoglycan-associated lipoprotein Pal [Collimonas pratensis]|uniref:Peptidoglycan-associated lipoprotein n=1 Tax=Collimonas pratensis TaxID=279113 RepID=A0A127Q8W6_9BURK|nr:peptidoglycan-associated lipoprotein Pal [Collimonas pratensis]AMP06478.1 peptidoglycan-associated lipoprotein [Collimonas pratensis]AMP16390.1 peptidoglycan-associated lipoprotein [Collimonas pratensis]NKI70718.1 peptidoglycan-associated lipoprotein Pal [Collimonas pratensis]